jgi:NAD(P)H dehydrogenase (quinone)
MGNVSTEMKAFMDGTLQRFYSRAWLDKIGAGFTVSATPSGDKLNTLTSLALFAMQLGMIWVGLDQTTLNDRGINRLGFYLGVGGQADHAGSGPALLPGDAESGEVLGARVARIARALAESR